MSDRNIKPPARRSLQPGLFERITPLGDIPVVVSSPLSVLVYDGRKEAFRTAVDVLTYGMDDVIAVPWESDVVQEFLEAQFGGRPFVFVLIEGNAVHAGETAVKKAMDARGIASPVARGVEALYPKIAAPFGRVVHGEAPAEIHGTYRLDPDAREFVESIRADHADRQE